MIIKYLLESESITTVKCKSLLNLLPVYLFVYTDVYRTSVFSIL